MYVAASCGRGCRLVAVEWCVAVVALSAAASPGEARGVAATLEVTRSMRGGRRARVGVLTRSVCGRSHQRQ